MLTNRNGKLSNNGTNSEPQQKVNIKTTRHNINYRDNYIKQLEPTNKLQKFSPQNENLNELFNEPFNSSDSDSLSQLCKSSQFARQMEIAMCECNSPTQSACKSKQSKITNCCCEEFSPEILVSTSAERVSEQFSLGTNSCPDSAVQLSGSHTKVSEKLNATLDVCEQPSNNNIFNTSDQWGEDINCDITRLMDSTAYKKQVSAVFDHLETTIIQDEPVDLGITINAIDWNETMVRGLQCSNATIAVDEHFTSLGPFYGLPAQVMRLIQQFKGIEKLYDWQHECLELEAVRLRKNLVYSLPTSGGKTLVSEILLIRELLCRQSNALLILPYVSIVQEKVWALSPFAVALDFLVEEYAAGKGAIPPRKRRHKRTIYIATIEKALALVNSLTEAGRLSELGLAVVDELHLLGEEGRGATLESLLTKLLCAPERMQIVAMSATIGNLPELCHFLEAEAFTKDFRPVELKEYVWCEGRLAECQDGGKLVEVPVSESRHPYNSQMSKMDPDHLGSLVLEVVPDGSCLLFCPTKKNCENVAILLSRILPRDLLEHKKNERRDLARQIEAENGLCDIHKRTLPFGIAYHHSGLTMDERRFIEDAFRNGTINVICCTSTLAAGVNLPAQRVILRSPYIGLQFITLSRYKQMSGRAGRAGLSEVGQSILVCERKDLERVRNLLGAPMDEVVSQLLSNDGRALRSLVLSFIALGTAPTRRSLQRMITKTLMAVQVNRLEENYKSATDKAICELFKQGALCIKQIPAANASNESRVVVSGEEAGSKQLVIANDTQLTVSELGRAATKSGLDLDRAQLLYEDLQRAKIRLVLLSSLHLLYLVTPYDLAAQLKKSPNALYQVYATLEAGELETANAIGITEACAASLASGRFPRTIPERILSRFYLAVMLHSLWQGGTILIISTRFDVSRGLVQQLMTSAATFASSVVHFCDELNEFWAFADMLRGMTLRLHHCASKDIVPLMELPSVKLARAKQLFNAGFKTLQLIASADPADIANKVEHMSRRLATQLVATAKLILLQKVDNLREEAEDVLEGLKKPNN